MSILGRIFSRAAAKAPETRSFDAARPATRRGLGRFGAINGEIATSSPTVRSRARYYAANNGHASLAVENWVAALVGPGVRPVHDDSEALARWDAWSRRTNFEGFLATMIRSMVVDGETLAVWSGDRLRPVPIEQLSDESDSRNLVSGIDLDADDNPVSYRIFPGRHESGGWQPAVRIDAAEVIHAFKPIAAGQVRGISWLAPSIIGLNELDQFLDAIVMRAKVSAMVVGFIESMEGPSTDLEALADLAPGQIARMGGGEKVTFNNPTPSAENGSLVSVKIREVAAGLGLPAHLVDGDLTGANYSSLRAGLLPFRAKVEQIQYGVIVPKILDPIWSRVTLASAPEWLMPRMPPVDPQKATASDVAELNAGLTSRRKLVAERGWNLDDLDAELKAEGWKPNVA